MKIQLLKIGSTRVYLHWANLALMIYMLLIRKGRLLMFSGLSILLHECAHALAARLCGVTVMELELTPLGAVVRLEDEQSITGFKRILVILAGPAMTFGLCAISIVAARENMLSVDAMRQLFMCNFAILMINFLPVLPLDGGRLLLAVLECFLPDAWTMRIMKASGVLLGLSCVGLNIWLTWNNGGLNFSLAACGCMMLYAAAVSTNTRMMETLRRLMDRKIYLERKGRRTCCLVALNATATYAETMNLIHPRKYTLFWISHYLTDQTLLLDESDMIQGFLRTPEKKILTGSKDMD